MVVVNFWKRTRSEGNLVYSQPTQAFFICLARQILQFLRSSLCRTLDGNGKIIESSWQVVLALLVLRYRGDVNSISTAGI